MDKKVFLNYIHCFRGLAILFILGLHATISMDWGNAQNQRKIALVLFNNGTLLFVFIAGYLFYHLNQTHFNYWNYLKKKLHFVILPYLLVSIPAIIDKLFIEVPGFHWWMDYGFENSSIFVKIVIMLITGRHMGVFWFIPMISIVYLLSPVILKFSKRKEFLYVAPILWAAGLFSFRFGYYANIYLSLIYFLPVYIFGIWVYQIRDYLFKNSRKIIITFGIIYFGMCLAEILEWLPFSEYIGLRDVKYSVYKLNPNKLKMSVLCILAITFLYTLSDKRLPALKLLGDYSFGIFFIHLYVIEVFQLLDKAGFVRIIPLSFWSFPIYYLSIITITLIIVKVVKYFLGDKSRYFIGA